MIGCEYCRMEDNGDYGRDLRPLMELEGGWTDSHTGKTVTNQFLEITVMGNTLNVCFNGEYEMIREIKYCPMCGRELKDD